MLGIAIHCIQHSQAMLERGVCELTHSFFHFMLAKLLNLEKKDSLSAERSFFLIFGDTLNFILVYIFFICLFSIEYVYKLSFDLFG